MVTTQPKNSVLLPTPRRGYLMLLALIFGAVFLTVLGGLSSYVLIQNRMEVLNTDKSKALTLAEAGLEYYHWHLEHFPTDLRNGTGGSGPYTITYTDPENGQGGGTYQLSIAGTTSCSQITSVVITSKGTPTNSTVSRTVVARYARPSVASYSYILNSSVWAGSDRVINGPYHSNGGIRMDGTSNAPVTSSLSTWTCTSSFGCSSNQTKNGVFGTGTDQTLWDYPTPQVDFTAIAADFTSLKTTAVASGNYFATNGSAVPTRGYHIIFNGNNTFTVKKVNSTTNPAFSPIDGVSTSDNTIIASETTLGTYSIPSTCGLIFVEDDVWVEGTIDKKVTLVAADVTNSGVKANIILPNNITYSATDGSVGLTAIAENNVLIAANSPQNMTLNGIFVAQTGAFGRNLYDCPSSYEPRGTLTIRGTTVSNLRTGTKWVNGCGSDDAGYQTRTDAFDRQLAADPPPFTPVTSTDYQFVDWREQ